MKCLICQKRNAVKIEPYGWLPCDKCRTKQRKIAKPNQTIEVTTNKIKDDRKKYGDDILQPFRDGEISKEYIKKYPDKVKTMIKEGNITTQEVKTAKNIWSDLKYYKE